MPPRSPVEEGNSPPWMASLCIGSAIAAAVLLLDLRYGTFLADEGYLWYGVQRVLAGDIPIRDFMSYEIGRYYLLAAVLGPLGSTGIIALRVSLGVWMALGLSLATALIGRAWNERRWTRLLAPALLLGVWMVPRHKIFDIVVPIILIFALARAIEKPGHARFFVLGLAAGMAGLIGQNHALYALAACGLCIAALWREQPSVRLWLQLLAVLAAGAIVAYLPAICFWLFVPGYFNALVAALRYMLLEYGATNIALPVPWPWRAVSAAGVQWSSFTVGLFFLSIPVFGAIASLQVVALARLRSLRKHPVFAAAVAVAIPYINVAFSRADAGHLAQAILPPLMAAMTMPWVIASFGAFRRTLVTLVLLLLSLVAAVPIHPRYQAAIAGSGRRVELDHTWIWLEPYSADFVLAIQRFHAAGPKGPTLAMPSPGISAMLHERNPLWEVYPLFPRSPSFQAKEIERLAAHPASLVVFSVQPLDGRPELAYAATHSDIYKYVLEHYQPIDVPAGSRSDLRFYRRKEP